MWSELLQVIWLSQYSPQLRVGLYHLQQGGKTECLLENSAECCWEAKRLGQCNTEFCCTRAGSDGSADRTDGLQVSSPSWMCADVPSCGCLCSLSEPALTQLCCQENPQKAKSGSEGHNQWVELRLEDAGTRQVLQGSILGPVLLDIIMNGLKEVPKGPLAEPADDVKLRGRMVGLTIQGDLNWLEGCTTQNSCNSARRDCAPGKEEPIEKIIAGEETTQGTPL